MRNPGSLTRYRLGVRLLLAGSSSLGRPKVSPWLLRSPLLHLPPSAPLGKPQVYFSPETFAASIQLGASNM